MIDRQHGHIVIECDACPEIFDGQPDEEWGPTWASAKRDGWKTRQIAGEWLHFCPGCKP